MYKVIKLCKCGKKALLGRRLCWNCFCKKEKEKRKIKFAKLKEKKRVKKEKKENSKSCLKKKADNLWFREYLKSYCEVCGASGVILQGHHYYFKGNFPELRHCEENHITLCKKCHFKLHFSGDQKKIEDKILAKRGKVWYNFLMVIKKERAGWGGFETVEYFQDIIKKYNIDKM